MRVFFGESASVGCSERPLGKPQLSRKPGPCCGHQGHLLISPGPLPKGIGRKGGIQSSEGQKGEEKERTRRRRNREEATGQLGRGRGGQCQAGQRACGSASSAAGPSAQPSPREGQSGGGRTAASSKAPGRFKVPFACHLHGQRGEHRAPAPLEHPKTPGRHPSLRLGGCPQELVTGLGRHRGMTASEDSVYPRISRA